MMKRPKHVLITLLLSCGQALFVGCRATPSLEAQFQSDLRQSARTFRQKAPSNRIEAAQQMLSLMPKCPVTFRKDIGTGELAAYDYSKPSYFLTRVEVVKLLGKPTSSTPAAFCYLVRERANNRTFFQIRFQGDFAVESTIYTTSE